MIEIDAMIEDIAEEEAVVVDIEVIVAMTVAMTIAEDIEEEMIAMIDDVMEKIVTLGKLLPFQLLQIASTKFNFEIFIIISAVEVDQGTVDVNLGNYISNCPQFSWE